MEEQNLINSDSSVPDTRNPQESATTGPSNGSDFQSTANDTVLNQEGQRELTVAKTGDPVDTPQPKSASNMNSQVMWGVLIAAVIVLVAFVVKRLLEEDDDKNYESGSPVVATAPTKKASTKQQAKKPAKKRTASKPKKRKKNSRRR